MNVPLAENDKILRSSIANVLDILVERVITVGDGRSVLSVYDQGSVDIVVLDIEMLGLNGLDMVKRIRAKDTSTPIVVVTSCEESL